MWHKADGKGAHWGQNSLFIFPNWSAIEWYLMFYHLVILHITNRLTYLLRRKGVISGNRRTVTFKPLTNSGNHHETLSIDKIIEYLCERGLANIWITCRREVENI